MPGRSVGIWLVFTITAAGLLGGTGHVWKLRQEAERSSENSLWQESLDEKLFNFRRQVSIWLGFSVSSSYECECVLNNPDAPSPVYSANWEEYPRRVKEKEATRSP